jgi:hypothetical protein
MEGLDTVVMDAMSKYGEAELRRDVDMVVREELLKRIKTVAGPEVEHRMSKAGIKDIVRDSLDKLLRQMKLDPDWRGAPDQPAPEQSRMAP